jgi:hypothetical protein
MILLSPTFSTGLLYPPSDSMFESFLARSEDIRSVSLLMRPVGVDRKVKAGDPAERCRLFILLAGPVGRL